MTTYGANASEVTKTANFIKKILSMKKYIQQLISITGLLEIQARFLFFSLQIKMSNLLRVGIILIISKVFTILCLLSLCRNREYPHNFQKNNSNQQALLSNNMTAQVKWDGMPFRRGQEAQIYSLNYLTYIAIGVMLTIIKVFIILFLLCLWEQGAPLKILECSGQNLLNSSCQFWNEKSIPLFKFLDKMIQSKSQFWHFQALWWKFAKFLMSFFKPQVSFSSKFA